MEHDIVPSRAQARHVIPWSLVVAVCVATWGIVVVWGLHTASAMAYVKGTAEECAPMGNLLRPLTVTLHRRGGGIGGLEVLGPSSTTGTFSIRVAPGNYHLTVGDRNDIIPSAAEHIHLSAGDVFMADIATVCQ